jgi:branched-chain amino acid transport system permease protein
LPAVFGASQIALGLIFILVMVFRPQGLFGDNEITLVSSGSSTSSGDRLKKEGV